tara:strand:+ start:1102 stop:1323 length:222 start_codon:yes stop_codon:yes gene_type:complete
MKYKAKPSYATLDNTENFISLNSASTHLLLLEGLEVEFKGKVSKDLLEHLEKVVKDNKPEVKKIVTSKSKENK